MALRICSAQLRDLSMHRALLAFKVFFRVLFNAAIAERIEAALNSAPTPERPSSASAPNPPASSAPTVKPSQPPAPARSEAIGLLAALQREARFVDFVKEDLAGYADAQIAAAARDVHLACRAVIERAFGPMPIVEAAEGSEVSVPAGHEAAQYKLVGEVTGQPPFRGKLCHHGWQATRCELPSWTGGMEAAHVIAPAEVELR
ncbi:MAG TPA: DUF2760 domain-containing protein [Pirellulales bacterium]|jgi:hypothetical protein|nr:DUF2760 domain-containing protein [Pirellulales bacterium]